MKECPINTNSFSNDKIKNSSVDFVNISRTIRLPTCAHCLYVTYLIPLLSQHIFKCSFNSMESRQLLRSPKLAGRPSSVTWSETPNVAGDVSEGWTGAGTSNFAGDVKWNVKCLVSWRLLTVWMFVEDWWYFGGWHCIYTFSGRLAQRLARIAIVSV